MSQMSQMSDDLGTYALNSHKTLKAQLKTLKKHCKNLQKTCKKTKK
jgi:hypothetical protein